jgi:hypothetical protein
METHLSCWLEIFVHYLLSVLDGRTQGNGLPWLITPNPLTLNWKVVPTVERLYILIDELESTFAICCWQLLAPLFTQSWTKFCVDSIRFYLPC